MYERFYELRERPFALSPDPDYLYPSRVHREALDYLRYGLESHAGFIVITGEIGSGKTTLLQTLLRGLDTQTTVGRIVNTILEPRELLETIMIDFGLDPAGRSKPLMLRDLAQYLVDQRLAGRLVLLVIDEAQNLSFAALEELRMLSNLETEKSKLLQIVLVGQPNLRDKLVAPELEQLRQRITVSYHLSPLDREEAANYINHRLRRAALGAPLEFPRDVTDLIHERSRGVPRVINVICDATLVFGYAEERRQIDLSLMHEVMMELEATGVLPSVPAAIAPPSERTAAVAAASPSATTPVERPSTPPAAAAPSASLVAPAVTVAAAASAASAGVSGQAPRMDLPLHTDLAVRRDPVRIDGGPTSGLPGKMEVSGQAGGYQQEGRAREAASAIATATRTQAIEGRVAALDQREQAIQQRERELAEQRRVLAQEYRLLRQRPTPPPPAPVTSSAPLRVAVARPIAPARFEPIRHETLWTRLKRFVLGLTAPAVEEN